MSFYPDNNTNVGKIIEEYLSANKIKKKKFAEMIGKSPKWVSQFISGVAVLTPETALDIEKVTEYNAVLLMKIEVRYRLALARSKR